jgi:hypothetical protein
MIVANSIAHLKPAAHDTVSFGRGKPDASFACATKEPTRLQGSMRNMGGEIGNTQVYAQHTLKE